MKQAEHYCPQPTSVKMQGMVVVDKVLNYFNNFGRELEETVANIRARQTVLKCLQAIVLRFSKHHLASSDTEMPLLVSLAFHFAAVN